MPSVYEKYQLKPVINASGRMTILGVSTPEQEVVDAVNFGLGHYFEVKDLVNKTGAYLAGLLGVEDAVVISCASAGIAQSVAAVIVRGDPYRLEHLHAHPHDVPSEIVLPKGHNVNFGAPVGTMVNLGGGKVTEAGYANECSPAQLAAAINANTAAILYIKSHHCVQKSILSVAEAAEVASAHGLPLIVDAAAEEDLRLYYSQGADLVIYSGAKAIEGPTSGLVLGKRQYVDGGNRPPHPSTRAIKRGKEGIRRLSHAPERYMAKEKESGAAMVAKMTPFIDRLNQLHGVTAKVVWDSAGRDLARTDIAFDHQQVGMTTVQVVTRLQQGTPAIYCRGYKANEGHIEIDVRSVTVPQLDQIHSAIANLVQENR